MKNIKTIILAIISCLLWSTAFTGVKIGLQYSAPLSFAGLRFMISGLILFFIFADLKNYFKLILQNLKTVLMLALFQTFILYALFYTGINMVSGATAAIIVGFAPLNTAIVAHNTMKDDKMTWKKSLSIMIGLIGIVIISVSRKPWSLQGFPEFIGIIILFVSSISGAYGNVIVAKEKKNMPPLLLASSQLFIGGTALFLISIPIEGTPTFNYPLEFFLALAWLAFLSAAAFTIWFNLLKKPGVKVSDLNLWKFIIPVFGAIWAWLILPDEKPQIVQIIGMVCIVLSIIAYHKCVNKDKSCI